MAWTEYVISVGPTDQDQAAKVKELMQMKEREQKRREQNVKDSKTYVFSPFTIHFFTESLYSSGVFCLRLIDLMIFFRKRLKNKQAQVDLQTENERLQAENKNLKVSENLMFLVF